MTAPKTFFIVFVTVFLAEMGDKTQLATILYATKAEYSRLVVFLGASFGLITATFIGVLAGSFIEQLIPRRLITILAGLGFVAIGLFMLIKWE